MRHLLIVSLGILGLTLAGCTSSGSSASQSASEGSTASSKPPKGVAPPAGHPLAKVEVGMAPGQVKKAMGEPTGESTYMTGKAWIPWYFGSDLQRTDWKYKGKGRVVFSHNRYSGALKVIRIDYDPEEDGY